MNLEIDQQQKFKEQFAILIQDASAKFKSKWDNEIFFINPSRKKIIPSFNNGVIDSLSVELRVKYESLRNRYYAKTL